MLKTPQEIKEMFNSISKNYDFLNNIISFFTHKFIKKSAVKMLKISNSSVLDLCCGSGDICFLIKKLYPNSKVTGLDFSSSMLKIAKEKVKDVDFIEGDVLNLPFLDNSFDFITISFGLRNIPNKKRALEEILRVLKPNGRLLHLDFGNKNLINKCYNFFILNLVKLFNMPKAYNYLIKSKELFLAPNELISLIESQGFIFDKRKGFFFNIISAQVFKKPV